jgi:hypothetical protein
LFLATDHEGEEVSHDHEHEAEDEAEDSAAPGVWVLQTNQSYIVCIYNNTGNLVG